MTRQRALIVDDEPDIRELLEITLGRMKLDTRSARNVKEAREWLAREPFDLCLTDMRLPDGTGQELVQYIQQRHPQVPVAMITAYGSLDTAINALKAGAFDFLTKPVDLGRLRELVATALRLRSGESDEEASVDSRLLGESPPCGHCATRFRNSPAARRPSTSAVSRVAARNWSHDSFMSKARAPVTHLCQSTAVPFRRS